MLGPITVAVRVRPFGLRVKEKECTIPAVSMDGPNITIHTTPSRSYRFDHNFWSCDKTSTSFASQETVYAELGQTMLRNVLEGYNSCLFAYGQTCSGKSYTIMGIDDQPGMIPRCVTELFVYKEALETDARKELRIWLSYAEIYNEHIRDLLSSGDEAPCELKIVDHPRLGVIVPQLTEAPCRVPEDVQTLLDCGLKRRVIGTTFMNERSSRSHAILTVKVQFLEGERPTSGARDLRRTLTAKASFTDLAGSERQPKFFLLREGDSVNQSLLALQSLIKELTDTSSTSVHQQGMPRGARVAFRGSKLTLMMKDSLAGNTRTCMIATVSPDIGCIQETVATLRFASCVRQVKTTAVQNKLRNDELLDELQEEIRRLRGRTDEYGEGSQPHNHLRRINDLESLVDYVNKEYTSRKVHIASDVDERVLNGDKNTPILLNMSDDPMVAGCLLYHFVADEITTIGASADSKITLKGIGISDRLCKISNLGNVEVTIEKVSQTGRLCVNGKLLHEGESRQLRNGDRLYLGRAYAFKVVIPLDNTSPDDQGLSLDGLQEEWSAIEDSQSWVSLQEYLTQVLAQIPNDQAHKLADEMKKGCELCDEANEISMECRADEGLHFEVDLTSSVPSSVVVRILQAEGPNAETEQWMYTTLYLWSVPQMVERLERMRDYHEVVMRSGTAALDPLLDPWHEPHPRAIARRLNELEVQSQLEREHTEQIRLKNRSSMDKTLLLRRKSEKGEIARCVFGNWATAIKGRPAPPEAHQVLVAQTSKKAKELTPRASSASSQSRKSNALQQQSTRSGTPMRSPRGSFKAGIAPTGRSQRLPSRATLGMTASRGHQAPSKRSSSASIEDRKSGAASPATTAAVPSGSGGGGAVGSGMSPGARAEDADAGTIAAPLQSHIVTMEQPSMRAPGDPTVVTAAGTQRAVLDATSRISGMPEWTTSLGPEMMDASAVEQVLNPASTSTMNVRTPTPVVIAAAAAEGSSVGRVSACGAASSGNICGNPAATTTSPPILTAEPPVDTTVACENELLRRQLEAAWQLCHVLRTRMAEHEQTKVQAHQELQQAENVRPFRASPSSSSHPSRIVQCAVSPRLSGAPDYATLSGTVSPRLSSEPFISAAPVEGHPSVQRRYSPNARSGISSPNPAYRIQGCNVSVPPASATASERTRSHSPVAGRIGMMSGFSVLSVPPVHQVGSACDNHRFPISVKIEPSAVPSTVRPAVSSAHVSVHSNASPILFQQQAAQVHPGATPIPITPAPAHVEVRPPPPTLVANRVERLVSNPLPLPSATVP